MVKIYNKDATNIFLDKESVDMFFMNPPYLNSYLEEYGGDSEKHINFVSDGRDYVKNILPLIKHVEYALKGSGSAFMMLPNDENSVILDLCNAVLNNTKLKIGKFFIWDFSMTPNSENIKSEKMGLILHLHKGKYYVDNRLVEYVLKIPLDPMPLRKYEDVGFVEAGLPVELYDHFVLAFSKPGDTVCDLVGGTGTIIESAKKLNRDFIYNDISESQMLVAMARLKDLEDSE